MVGQHNQTEPELVNAGLVKNNHKIWELFLELSW